jgi:hypothetical protein
LGDKSEHLNPHADGNAKSYKTNPTYVIDSGHIGFTIAPSQNADSDHPYNEIEKDKGRQ